MADNLEIMKQKLLQSKHWVSPTIFNLQEKFVELPTMDISMIGAAFFNTFVQQASHAKNIEIISISVRDIKEILALKSTTNLAKKLSTEYHDFLNVFSWTNSNILPLQHFYDHKIPLMEEKTPP